MRDSTEVIVLSKWPVVIGVLALIVACVAIVVGLLTPEIRYFLGLEQRQKARLDEPAIVLPTPRPQPTATLPASLPTATRAMPTPTIALPTRLPPTATAAPLVSDFAVISVSSNSEQSAPYVNLGLEISSRKLLLNIPFETGWTSTTQCSHVPERPTTLQYNVDIPRPTNVYLLLQGGWALQEYNGKEVGYVLLGFSGGANHKTSLVLGFNFRDWSVDKPNAVTTASSPTLREAWQGIAPDGAKGRFDILTIEIPGPLTQSRLTSVQIVDTSTTTTGSVNPCIHLTGITVKYFRQ